MVPSKFVSRSSRIVQNVAMFVRSDPSGDPRPFRFLKSLEGFVNLDVYCPRVESKSSFLESANFLFFRQPSKQLARRAVSMVSLLFGLGLAGGYGSKAHLALLRWELRGTVQKTYDVIIVFELEFLALSEVFTTAFVADLREYYPEQFLPRSLTGALRNRHAQRTLVRYLPFCKVTTTVSGGLRSLYIEKFSVVPEVIESMPLASNRRFPCSKTKPLVRLVHHGTANPLRSIGRIVEAVGALPERYCLDLFLVGKPAEIAQLDRLASDFSNVRVRPKLSFDEILPTVAKYDLGLPFFPGEKTKNLRFSMPNKFFEYLRAGIPVICSSSTTEMSRFILQRQVGFVSHDDSSGSLQSLLMSLELKEIREAKSRVGSMQVEFDWSEKNLEWIKHTILGLTENKSIAA